MSQHMATTTLNYLFWPLQILHAQNLLLGPAWRTASSWGLYYNINFGTSSFGFSLPWFTPLALIWNGIYSLGISLPVTCHCKTTVCKQVSILATRDKGGSSVGTRNTIKLPTTT
uniref:Uncharacterized protein n=1 Tax=Opuntia streptacantha TaxID=393608 RepID=A0A7C9CR33_OPUST